MMPTINERINQVVLYSGLTKTDFGKEINLTQSMVSKLCSGAAAPSARTISDICRVFTINESWLRTGDGEMVNIQARDAVIDELITKMLDTPEDMRDILRAALVRLPDSVLMDIVERYWKERDVRKIDPKEETPPQD